MAVITTVKDGNWSDPTVWDSGSVPGAADEPHISHVVVDDRGNDATKYTAPWTIESGGELRVPYDADTILKAGEGWKLVGKSGGKWRFVSDTLIDSAHEYRIEIDQGNAERTVLDFEEGFEFDIKSNPAWYGGTRKFPLHQNWSSGDTLYVTGDATGWKAGGKIWLQRNNSDWNTDARIYTVNSIGSFDGEKTPIQVTESGPYFEHVAIRGNQITSVVFLARNVFIGDIDLWNSLQVGLSWTNRLTTSFGSIAQTLGGCLVGFTKLVESGEKINLTDASLISTSYTVPGGTIENFTGDVTEGNNIVRDGGAIKSFSGDINGADHVVRYSGVIEDFVGNINGCTNIVGIGGIIGNLVGNLNGPNFAVREGGIIENFSGNINGGNYIAREGGIIENFSGNINGGTNIVRYGGVIGNFSGDINGGNYIVTYRGIIENFSGNINGGTNVIRDGGVIKSFSGVFPSTAVVKQESKGRINLVNSTIDGSFYGNYYVEEAVGKIVPLLPGDSDYKVPPSGEEAIHQFLPNSHCKGYLPLELWLEYGKNCIKSGQHTLTFRIYPVGWSADLAEDDLEFWVEYYSSDTDYSRSRVSCVHISPNGAWRDITVSFDHKHDGEIRFNLSLKKYESGAYVLVDPLPKEWVT